MFPNHCLSWTAPSKQNKGSFEGNNFSCLAWDNSIYDSVHCHPDRFAEAFVWPLLKHLQWNTLQEAISAVLVLLTFLLAPKCSLGISEYLIARKEYLVLGIWEGLHGTGKHERSSLWATDKWEPQVFSPTYCFSYLGSRINDTGYFNNVFTKTRGDLSLYM